MADSSSELHLEIETLERKHAENPEGRFFVPLANAYRKMGDVETAEALLRSGVERHPDYLSAHIVLGRCLADRGDASGAEEEFRYVLSRDPQNLIALRTLGEIAAGDGRPGEAADWYRELLAVDPMNEEARLALEALSRAPETGAEPAENPSWWKERSGPELETDSPSLDDAEAEDPFGAPVPEVVTETIAELYTRQGLHDRAAEVYRELIRRRGEDEGLARRLAQVERLARGEEIEDEVAEGAGELVLTDEEALPTPAMDAGTADEETVHTGYPADPDPDPDPDAGVDPAVEDPEDDPFAASVVGGLTLLSLDEDDAPADGQELDEAPAVAAAATSEDAGGDRSIAGFLTRLATWSRGGDADSAPEREAAGEAEVEATAAWTDSPVAEGTGEAADEPWLDALSSEPQPGEAVGELEAFDDSANPLDDLSFLETVDADAPADGGAEEETAVPTSSAAPDDGGDDEDLESFQAWLRSLKR